MTLSLILTLVGIAFVDSLNPSLFLTQFYLLTTRRPVPRMLSYIGGVVLVNYVGGLLVLSGVQTFLLGLLDNFEPGMLRGGQLLLGLALVGFGLWLPLGNGREGEAKKPRTLHPVHTFALGMLVMLNEIPTALPYFIAIQRIADAELGTLGVLLAFFIYNLIFSLPLFLFVGLFLLYGPRFTARIDQLSRWLQVWLPRVFKYGAILLGAFLALDAGLYFAAGFGLWR